MEISLSDYPFSDSKVHGANMGPIWGRQDPGGPHVGPMNFVIWVDIPKTFCIIIHEILLDDCITSASEVVRLTGLILINTLRPKQNSRHFLDDIFKCIFLNENVWMSFELSLKFDPKGQINNIPTLVQIMACRRPGDKPLSEPMMVSLLTQGCFYV